MSNRCDQLRDAYLLEGAGGRADMVWRLHCRSCEACRTDLFVLDALQRQAHQERQHLGRREVAVLLDQVRHRHDSRRPVTWGWSWGLGFCCAWLVLLTVVLLNRHSAGESGPSAEPALARAGAASPATGRSLAAAGDAQTGSETARQVLLDSRSVDSCLHRIRARVSNRRDSLLKLLEEDLGDNGHQDVWNTDLSPSLALV